jgi:Rrf2 family protein
MKLSRTITYAIHAMLHLAVAEVGVPVPCSQLARAEKMPERFLLQVLRSLVNHGLLRSTRGVDGGYFLAKPPSEITVCDIVEAFDNPLEPRLPEINDKASHVRDRIMETLQRTSQAARRELNCLTLADLMSESEVDENDSQEGEYSGAHEPPARCDQ